MTNQEYEKKLQELQAEIDKLKAKRASQKEHRKEWLTVLGVEQ